MHNQAGNRSGNNCWPQSVLVEVLDQVRSSSLRKSHVLKICHAPTQNSAKCTGGRLRKTRSWLALCAILLDSGRSTHRSQSTPSYRQKSHSNSSQGASIHTVCRSVIHEHVCTNRFTAHAATKSRGIQCQTVQGLRTSLARCEMHLIHFPCPTSG